MADNFIAGIAPGGLKEVYEVKILICYLLYSVEKPLSVDNINEIFSKDDAVDYFTFTTAFAELKNSGHLKEIESDGVLYYSLAELGIETAVSLQQALPSSLREKVTKRGLKLLAELRRENEIKTDIVKKDKGFDVICIVEDGGVEYLKLKIYAPDIETAETIEENFKKNSVEIYEGILSKVL